MFSHFHGATKGLPAGLEMKKNPQVTMWLLRIKNSRQMQLFRGVEKTWGRPWPRSWCRPWPTLWPTLWLTSGQIFKNIKETSGRVVKS